MTQQRIESTDFNHCPHCNGTDLERQNLAEREQSLVILIVHCENCGKEFEAVYSFVRYQKLEEEE
jgi:transcription elongation factor Elf1